MVIDIKKDVIVCSLLLIVCSLIFLVLVPSVSTIDTTTSTIPFVSNPPNHYSLIKISDIYDSDNDKQEISVYYGLIVLPNEKPRLLSGLTDTFIKNNGIMD